MESVYDISGKYAALFATMIAEVRAAGTDNPSFFMCGSTVEGGLSLQQNAYEFAALTVFLMKTRPPGESYLEIGSASGGAARFLERYLKCSQMFSVDDGAHHRYPELPGNFAELPMMEHVKGDSHGPEVAAWLGSKPGPFDIVFIDGDHSEEGVWKDVRLVRPKLRSGSAVIFHDTVACDGVKRAWNRGSEEGIWQQAAEFIGPERPLGIGVGVVR